MMVVGSTIDDVITVQAPPTSSLRSEAASGGNHLFHTNLHCIISHIHTYTMGMYVCIDTKDPLSELTEHKKIIEKGIPEGVPPGFKHKHVS